MGFGVQQRSILEPLLFNIYLANLFLVMDDIDIANYADDNTPYVTADDIDGDIASLENACFIDNLFKGNSDRCHLLVDTVQKMKFSIKDFFFSWRNP